MPKSPDQLRTDINDSFNKLQPLTNEALGKAFRAYLNDSIHDTDWEGYPTEDLDGIDALLRDFVLAVENGLVG